MKNGFYRLIALLLCAVVLLGLGSPAAAVSQAVPSLTGLSADKAMYAPGETATFTVDIDNSGGEAWNGTLYFQIYHLENAVAALNIQVSVPADAKTTCTAQWVLPEQDFTGYLVKAYFNEDVGDHRPGLLLGLHRISPVWVCFGLHRRHGPGPGGDPGPFGPVSHQRLSALRLDVAA